MPKYDFARKHDILFRYSKTENVVFNVDAVRVAYSEDSSERLKYKARSFRESGTYDNYNQNPRGKHPEDWWPMQPIMPSSKERVGYPTQKPLALLDRIIKASSNEGNLVLDPFAGCATACVAAERLHRQWVGIDISEKAAELVQVRIRREIDLFHDFKPIRRSEVPQRTDLGKLPNYRTHKHQLFGKQEGHCRGCRVAFPFRNFTVDHVVPRTRGGTDHLDNLQLLCGACNSLKGDREQQYLVAKLREQGILS